MAALPQRHILRSRSSSAPPTLQSLPPPPPPSPPVSSTNSTHNNGTNNVHTRLDARQYGILVIGDLNSFRNQFHIVVNGIGPSTQPPNPTTSPPLRLVDLVWDMHNSTVLHIAAQAGHQRLISDIIEQEIELIHRPNSDGDLPIHVAARAGKLAAAKELLAERAIYDVLRASIIRQLETSNNDGNTALHIALENKHREMAEYLLGECTHVLLQLNEQGISPLYLAVKAGYWELVQSMLRVEDTAIPQQLISDFKERGRSVVHDAILAGKKDTVDAIIRRYPYAAYSLDNKGRTALSYASMIGFNNGVEYLLQDRYKKITPFQLDKDGFFPIHKACVGGNIEIVKEFFSRCPDETKELLNNKGQNILHVAAGYGNANLVKFLLGEIEVEGLINMKDKDGNTPLHLATLGKHAKVVYTLTWDSRVDLKLENKEGFTALDLAEVYGDEVPSFKERLVWASLVHANAPKSPEKTMEDIENKGKAIANPRSRHPSEKITYKNRLETLLVVSTLVATVTFAANFTLPGGYNSASASGSGSGSDSDKHRSGDGKMMILGMATLAHKPAFKVFAFSNTVAMFSSILAAVMLIWANLDDHRLSSLSLRLALPFLGTALAMMSVAFIAGLYVAWHVVCPVLSLALLILASLFLALILAFLIPLCSTSSPIKFKFLRFLLCPIFHLLLRACDH